MHDAPPLSAVPVLAAIAIAAPLALLAFLLLGWWDHGASLEPGAGDPAATAPVEPAR